jgi:hypothetical protein
VAVACAISSVLMASQAIFSKPILCMTARVNLAEYAKRQSSVAFKVSVQPFTVGAVNDETHR